MGVIHGWFYTFWIYNLRTLNFNVETRYISEFSKHALYLFIRRSSTALIYGLRTNLLGIKIWLFFYSNIISDFQNGGLMWPWQLFLFADHWFACPHPALGFHSAECSGAGTQNPYCHVLHTLDPLTSFFFSKYTLTSRLGWLHSIPYLSINNALLSERFWGMWQGESVVFSLPGKGGFLLSAAWGCTSWQPGRFPFQTVVAKMESRVPEGMGWQK